MDLTSYPFRLEFKRMFKIAAGARSGTDAVYVELHQDGLVGYGEAALPPYLPETIDSVTAFVKKASLSDLQKGNLQQLLDEVDAIEPDNFAAKAAIDIALHDLYGKLTHQSVQQILGINSTAPTLSTYTLGISDEATMRSALEDATPFNIIKLKLGGGDDKLAVETLLSLTDKPFCVDVNQGWANVNHAISMADWLHKKGAFFLEQPLPKTNIMGMKILTNNSPIPIIADEAVWRTNDLWKLKGACNGINIKLMKTGGLAEAMRMIKKARQMGLKILLGCMSESSCAVTAAAHLAPLCDWADLDGPYLIANDPFKGMTVEDGLVKVPAGDGLGIVKL